MTPRSKSIPSIVLLILVSWILAPAQTPCTTHLASPSVLLQKTADRNKNSDAAQSKQTDAKNSARGQSLTAAEARLVTGSKKAILETGISELYFEEHFHLLSAIDNPGDRRIVWKYSINEYEATINDAVGFYTSDDGERVDRHSIKDMLGSTHDIEKTIPKKQAERIMRKCIGRYAGLTVAFGVYTKPGKASLFMTASPIARNRAETEKRVREERRKESEKSSSKQKASESDTLEEEGDERKRPSYFGIVNLETGECTKGRAIIGPWSMLGPIFFPGTSLYSGS